MSKIVGFIGGVAWPSTLEYYRIYNEETNKVLGGNNTAEAAIYSVNLSDYLKLAMNNDTEELTNKFEAVANNLIASGAGLVEICSNTMHLVYDELEKRISVPMIHIVDATAERAKELGITKVGLLGTPVTMGTDFYKKRLQEKHNIETIVPKKEHWEKIFSVIEEELTFNNIVEESREYYINVIEEMRAEGAQGVVLGCTEIPLLVRQQDSEIPVFDTTEWHAKAAAAWAVK